MNYADYYYCDVCGYYPDVNQYLKTKMFFDYLIDCSINEKDIINIILKSDKHEALTFDMLPEELWEKSLLEKNKFYYHRMLHLTSLPPKWNPETNTIQKNKFYLEMIIKFTEEDIVAYFYKQLDIDKILINKNSDIGAVKFLLDKYKKFAFISPVDFILFLIDYSKDNMNTNKINNILQLSQNENEVYEILKSKVDDASFHNKNKIMWRN